MRHIDINPLIEAVKNIEAQEVRSLLRSRSGADSVSVLQDTPVAVEFYGGNGPASALVRSVRLCKDGSISVTVWDDIAGGTYEISPSDIYPGQLLGIFDNL